MVGPNWYDIEMKQFNKMIWSGLILSSLTGVLSPTASALEPPGQMQSGVGECSALNAEATLSIEPEKLLSSTIMLMAEMDIRLFSEVVISDLMIIGKCKDRQELLSVDAQFKILNQLQRKLGEEKYRAVIGKSVATIADTVRKQDLEELTKLRPQDDFLRGWGVMLIPEMDRAFSDPMYLINLLRVSGQTGSNYVNRDMPQARRMFQHAWERNTHGKSFPEVFVTTGSDANSLVYDIASKVLDSPDAKVLTLKGMYLGTRGKSAENKTFIDMPVLRDFPTVNEFTEKELSDPVHQPKLAKALLDAEEFLKSKMIGAVLIETIFSNPGIGALHPDFVNGLRALCDKFGTPLVVDEIMTGGGRTGKFFAFEHYAGFEPDFITFGKGMQVAGIARQQRTSGMVNGVGPSDGTTVGAQLEPLLKGAQVLNRIHQDGLAQNAADVGRYLVDSVRQVRPKSKVQGFGLIIKGVPEVKGVEASFGRWLPPLTLTRENVDTIVSRMENK